MPGGGVVRNDWFSPKPAPQMPTMQYGNPNTFTTAANQQAKDYDKIMGMYGDVYNTATQNPIQPGNVNFSGITPQISKYQKSQDVTKALGDLSELSSTGGYSAADIADLRARGVSPLRSIYASANRNLSRGRALSGGYSPNAGALTAKMAREQADLIGGKMTDINAGIAQNVASNKLSASPAYASAAQRENEAEIALNAHNADIFNDVNKFNSTGNLNADTTNAQMFMDSQRNNINNRLGAVEGMRGLYGTTPALTNTFGNQVSDAARLNQNQQQVNNVNQNQQLSTLFGNRRLG